MKSKLPILAAIALLMGSCGAITPPNSSGSSAVPSSSNPTSSSSLPGGSSSSKFETEATHFTVRFHTFGDHYDAVEVQSKENVARPADPAWEGHVFDGWYIDPDCTIPFDFGEPVLSDMTVYAKWKEIGDFSQFDERFIPSYSPFVLDGTPYIGAVNPTLSFAYQGAGILSSIDPSQISLGGALDQMGVTGVHVHGNSVKVGLKGTLRGGTGYVTFARELTSFGEYFTTTVPLEQRYVYLNPLSFEYETGDKHAIKFNLQISADKIRNPDNLPSGEYRDKLNSGECPYLTLSNAEGISMEVFGVSEDFSAIGIKLNLSENLGDDVLERLKKVNLIALGNAFESGVDHVLPLDFTSYESQSTATVYQIDPTHYQGNAEIRLGNLRITSGFKDRKDALLADPINKSLIVKVNGVDTKVTGIDLPDGDKTIKVDFSFEGESISSGDIVIDLNPIKLSEEDTVYFTKKLWNDDTVAPTPENLAFETTIKKAETGTVSQTASSSYTGIRQAVQGESFGQTSHPEDMGDIPALMRGATGIAKIGAGIYSGDFTMAKNAAGDLFGIDSLRNPTTLIMENLQKILDELKVVESKLDGISDQLQLVQAELESLGRSSILNNFLTAHSAWIDFVTDYYTPLTNQLSTYSNQYFRYYYDFVKRSNASNGGLTLTLHYDYEGNLAFPDEYGSDSIDFRPIDPTKTKVIKIKPLGSALAGIRANKGHSYPKIEDDLIADIANRNDFDDELLLDIAKTIRFQAMDSYFDTRQKMDDFSNVFNNFCRALTGTQLSSAIKPLDACEIMLESVYNFGFEVEPEMNLALIKLTTTYHVAESLASYVTAINTGTLVHSQADEDMRGKVADELSSGRFFHNNDANGNVYCYAAGTYVSAKVNQYAVYYYRDYDDDDNNWSKIVVNNISDPNGPGLGEFRSISEADVRFMNLKCKVLNQVKHTNYRFDEYFASIGIIPKNLVGHVKGIALEIHGNIWEEDEVSALSVPEPLDWKGDKKWPSELKDVLDQNAIKGKMYSFSKEKEGQIFDGLVVVMTGPGNDYFAAGHLYWWAGGHIFGEGDLKWTASGDYVYGGGAYAYYLNLAPVN